MVGVNEDRDAVRLAGELFSATTSGGWNRRLNIEPKAGTEDLGGHVILHSPSVMMHFSEGNSGGGINGSNFDEWGQVQPQVI